MQQFKRYLITPGIAGRHVDIVNQQDQPTTIWRTIVSALPSLKAALQGALKRVRRRKMGESQLLERRFGSSTLKILSD